MKKKISMKMYRYIKGQVYIYLFKSNNSISTGRIDGGRKVKLN